MLRCRDRAKMQLVDGPADTGLTGGLEKAASCSGLGRRDPWLGSHGRGCQRGE